MWNASSGGAAGGGAAGGGVLDHACIEPCKPCNLPCNTIPVTKISHVRYMCIVHSNTNTSPYHHSFTLASIRSGAIVDTSR